MSSSNQEPRTAVHGRLLPVTIGIPSTLDRPLLGESRHSLAAPLSLWSAISNVAYGSEADLTDHLVQS